MNKKYKEKINMRLASLTKYVFILILAVIFTFIIYIGLSLNTFSTERSIGNYKEEVSKIYYEGFQNNNFRELKIECERDGDISKVFNNGINSVEYKGDIKLKIKDYLGEKIVYKKSVFKIYDNICYYKILKIKFVEETQKFEAKVIVNFKNVLITFIAFFIIFYISYSVEEAKQKENYKIEEEASSITEEQVQLPKPKKKRKKKNKSKKKKK